MLSRMDELKSELRTRVGAENLIDVGETLETLSKDFYWYSPVLRRQLDDKRADLAVRPGSREELRDVVAACWRARVPVVARGAGTGNYGQCVPLYGGAVIDFTRLDKILSLEGGVARVEAGARLGTIEAEVRKTGWELRCMPSTWVKCTMAGFPVSYTHLDVYKRQPRPHRGAPPCFPAARPNPLACRRAGAAAPANTSKSPSIASRGSPRHR